MRQWRARNKEKVKAYQEKYWRKKAKESAILREKMKIDAARIADSGI